MLIVFFNFRISSKAKNIFVIFLTGTSLSLFALSHNLFSEDEKMQVKPGEGKAENFDTLSELLKSQIESQNSYISLLFAGDTHFNWGVADLQKGEGLLAPVEQIQALFTKVDFRALNLESVLTNKGYPFKGKSYIFHSLSNNVSVLKYLQVDLVILGNNHSMDMGIHGLMDMRTLLAEAGIGTVGAGENSEQALKPYYFQRQGVKKTHIHKFAILSLSQVGHSGIFSHASRPGVAKNLKPARLLKLSREVRPIVSLHWGREYFLRPSSAQVKLAHKLIEQGASAVIGHHPHIPQAVELYKNGVIFYSLGNFLFGSVNGLQRDNIVAILDYSKAKGTLERVRIIPIQGSYRKNGHKIRLLNIKEMQAFWKRYYLIIQKHSSNTLERLSVRKGIGILRL